MTYYANAFTARDRLTPADRVPALGVLTDPANAMHIIGLAFPVGHVGGIEQGRDRFDRDYPPPELVFRITIEREWQGRMMVRLKEGVNLDGRFVLRRGVFVELSEEAT